MPSYYMSFMTHFSAVKAYIELVWPMAMAVYTRTIIGEGSVANLGNTAHEL